MYTPVCGNRIVEAGEGCDDGNNVGGDGCNACSREVAICGNGAMEAREECDDNNRRDFDGCDSRCKLETGGCGDGILQRGYGEECDLGQLNGIKDAVCSSVCQKVILPRCGDGIVDPESEECDNGSLNGDYSTTSCLSNCLLPYCSDGIREVNEQCDDGNLFDYDGCNYACEVEQAAPPEERIPEPTPKTITAAIIPYERVPTPTRSNVGPEAVLFIAAGAAAGIGWARRRMGKS